MRGFVSFYQRESKLNIDAGLGISSEYDEEIDPITYEVIRHSLWNVNVEHGMTMVNISGSPIAIYAHDFNTTILTELGEWVYIGPFLQVLAASADSAVKWTLENRSTNPGIYDGDIFLTNDPWIGAIHQQDVNTLCPIFHEGKLFAWVTNTLHQYDLGGSTPGSFCPDARDVYWESIPIPPIKIVERGEIRRDVEESYIRRSRLQQLISLDLRAMVAGCIAAKKRIVGLIERYGPRVVKGVMNKITRDAEKAFSERLSTIPEGTWRERNYLEVALPGDRGIYEVMLTVTKKKDMLVFSNEGTHEQVGALNNTYIGWRGAILTGISQIFLHDQLYAIGGALKHIEFRPVFGRITCASYPAAVSVSPPSATLLTQGQSLNCLSKMITSSSSDDLRREANAKFSANQFPVVSLNGIDQRGEPVSGILLDPMSSAIGAFPHRDGIATGGYPFDPLAMCPNVEYSEQFFPLLYLYRREVMDSGGAGKFRGGNSAVSAFTVHGTKEIDISTTTSGALVPTTNGLFGGYPGSTNRFMVLEGSDLEEWFGRKELCDDINLLRGNSRMIASKERNIILRPADIFEVYAGGAGGYGDPLERDASAVLRDVAASEISIEAARKLYGVVLEGEPLNFKRNEVEKSRKEIFTERIGHSKMLEHGKEGLKGLPISQYLSLQKTNSTVSVVCRVCGKRLCDPSQNYKKNCVIRDARLSDANLLIDDELPLKFIEERVVFRQFFCPGCGLNIENEICRRDDEPLLDIEISADVVWTESEDREASGTD
jgi:N-methylhydantoinase B